jgi:F-type H+-transporting ATPase subunit b
MHQFLNPILAAPAVLETEAAEEGILHQFGVTWPSFIAQVIVFLIVFWILKTYAFGPIIEVLEKRRRRIEESMADADRIKAQLAETEARTQEMIDDAHAESRRLIEEARKSSQALSDRKTQEAIKEAEAIIARAHESNERERQKMFEDLKKEVGRLVVVTTEQVANKVLDEEDKRRLNDEVAKQVAASN